MADANRESDIEALQRHLNEVTKRIGPHSTIAETLTAALGSGNDGDLSAGLFAYTHFDQHYEQLTLEESRRRVHLARLHDEREKKQREWRERLEREGAQRHRPVGEAPFPDGPEFSHPLSTSGRRHLLAKTPRSKRRVVLKKKPRR
jgi:hypothetical protein